MVSFQVFFSSNTFTINYHINPFCLTFALKTNLYLVLWTKAKLKAMTTPVIIVSFCESCC